nr:unnamed protein product [Callosobruchus analis]
MDALPHHATVTVEVAVAEGHVPDRHAEEEAARDVPHPGAAAALTARAVVAGPGPHPGRMDAPDPDHKHRLAANCVQNLS